jgi:hypothetical protein
VPPQKRLAKSELIRLVDDIMNARFATDEDLNEALEIFKANVPHPQASDLIFYSEREMTPEEIVNIALAYKPIQL